MFFLQFYKAKYKGNAKVLFRILQRQIEFVEGSNFLVRGHGTLKITNLWKARFPEYLIKHMETHDPASNHFLILLVIHD